MLIESLAGLLAGRLGTVSLPGRSTVDKPPFGGVSFGFFASGALARDPQIDNFGHPPLIPHYPEFDSGRQYLLVLNNSNPPKCANTVATATRKLTPTRMRLTGPARNTRFSE
jgi:hypothetical protein